jgi:hypothetical protein
MVSSYSITSKKDYLVLTITGQYNYWEFIRYPDEILQDCKEWKIYKVLVDLRPLKAKDVSMIELFFLGEKIAHVFKNTVKLALVWKKQSLSEFMVDVATNRSASLKVFDSEKRASFWLLNDY